MPKEMNQRCSYGCGRYPVSASEFVEVMTVEATLQWVPARQGDWLPKREWAYCVWAGTNGREIPILSPLENGSAHNQTFSDLIDRSG
jgi:hypothetical protein